MSQNKNRRPSVVIVGRPNVGKSTLFNRLVGRRLAITDETSGVTRDPVSSDGVIDELPVQFVDTGGMTLEKGVINELVTARSMEMAVRARCIILLLDVTQVTAEDEEFIEKLRPFERRIVVAVNKVDNPERDVAVWDFHRFGFAPVIGISATHGRNIDDLIEAVHARLIEVEEAGLDTEESADAEEELRIAILGQPNTGKSTLGNRLVGANNSIVSDIPGTTRDIVEGHFKHKGTRFRVLDTAGIRRKSRVNEDVEYYSVNRALKSIDDADVVFLLIDVIKGLADQDKKIAAQVVKKGKGIILVLNKWDLLPEVGNQFAAIEDRIRFFFPVLHFAPVMPISAANGNGITKLLNMAVQIRNELGTRIETGRLNQSLARWIEHTPPPSGKRHWKIRYMTQVSVHPIQFVVFVSRTTGFPRSYVGYLQNQIRREFNLTHVPLDIMLRD
jgi:GTP-binding protein